MKKATGLVLLSVLLAACGCAAPTPDIPVPTYDVVEVDDISLAHSVRLRVVVTTEFPIVTEQIGALCEEVVQDLKSQGPLNAVVVFLYDTRSVVSGAYSIARCEYAPNGVWEDAGKVQAGDYSTHRFAYEYRPKVGDPDAALPERPTEQEHNLCQQWDRLAFELISESDDVAASEALGELASTGVALLLELFKGRPCRGVDAPSKNSPFPSEDGRGVPFCAWSAPNTGTRLEALLSGLTAS